MGSSKILIQDRFHRSREFRLRKSAPQPAPEKLGRFDEYSQIYSKLKRCSLKALFSQKAEADFSSFFYLPVPLFLPFSLFFFLSFFRNSSLFLFQSFFISLLLTLTFFSLCFSPPLSLSVCVWLCLCLSLFLFPFCFR